MLYPQPNKLEIFSFLYIIISCKMSNYINFNLNSKQEEKSAKNPKNEVITTLEELEGLAIIKSLLNGVIDINRITYRDTVNPLPTTRFLILKFILISCLF